MSPSRLLFQRKRLVRLKTGDLLSVFMDPYEITGSTALGLFLDRYRFSWIAFDPNEPLRRVLMDCHHPFGIHLHLNEFERQSIQANSLKEALLAFEKLIVIRFGELEDSIYEDVYF